MPNSIWRAMLVGASLLTLPVLAQDPHAAHHRQMKQAAEDKPDRYKSKIVAYSVPDVILKDQTGADVNLRSVLESGEPVALNFIFTTCTTICPVMTSTFSQMRRELGENAKAIRYVSVSIDPEHDRPAILAEYATRFGIGEGWQLLTGDAEDITSTLEAFEAVFGSKMNHRPVTLLRRGGDWLRIDGLANGADLASEYGLLAR